MLARLMDRELARGVAGVAILAVVGGFLGDESDESDNSDRSEARHGAQVCKLLHDHKEDCSVCRAHVESLRSGLRESGVAVEGR